VVAARPLFGRPAPDVIDRIEDLYSVDVLVADGLALVDLEGIALVRLTDRLADEFQLASLLGGFRILIILFITLGQRFF